MNTWPQFILALVVRLVAGVVLGCLGAFFLGTRVIARAAANDGFPVERFVVWGVIGGVVCVLTTPRRYWPWMNGEGGDES